MLCAFPCDMATSSAHRLQQTKAELEERRYKEFTAAMCQVNTHLSGIYQTLLGADGDAQCSFNDDPAALFTEGVTLRIRLGMGTCHGQLLDAWGGRGPAWMTMPPCCL